MSPVNGSSVRADLHTHSVRSDGLTPPAALAVLAARAGVGVLALTDHDTTAGWSEAASACRDNDIAFVPGVELSAEAEGRSVHVLGYWVDADDAALVAECARLRGERDRRAAVMVDRLRAAGMDVRLERVRAHAADAPVGRPHVAAAMVEAGAVPDLATAFDVWLAEGRPAYEPKHALHPVEAVALLRGAGGVAVLAHPGAGAQRGAGAVDLDLVDAMAAAGLAGIEVDTPAHDAAVADRWRNAARARHLVVTGASDYHGRPDGSLVGDRWTGADALDALAAARGPAGSEDGQ